MKSAIIKFNTVKTNNSIKSNLGGISDMKKIQMIKKQLEEYMEELDVSVQQTEKNLRRVPEGKLILSRSNGSEQYYHKIEQGQKKEHIYRQTTETWQRL